MPIEVETGSFEGLNRTGRVYTLYDTGEVEDQIHFALHCLVNAIITRADFIVQCRERIYWMGITDIGKISTLFNELPRLFGKYL